MNRRLKNLVKQLPKNSGVYLFKNKVGRLLYIGKAVNLKNRIRSHFELRAPASNARVLPRSLPASARSAAPHQKTRPQKTRLGLSGAGWRDKVTSLDWIETDDEKQACLLENDLIKKYKPRYNIQWRDDKSYLWVALSDDEWPRVQIVHQTKLKNPLSPRFRKIKTNQPSFTKEEDKLNSSIFKERLGGILSKNDKNIIGPFTNGRQLRQLLRALRKILPYRTCKNPYDKPCLQWYLGLCPAHNPRSYDIGYHKNLLKYLNGIKTMLQFLRLYAGEAIRIEAYDISNIHGGWATGSLAVFYGRKPHKSSYRHFKIKSVRGANDVAMIKEVLMRRWGHPEWPYPDLILIDGGLTQLQAAAQTTKRFQRSSRLFSELKNEKKIIPTIALAKQQEEIYTEYSDKALMLKALPTELELTFQAIRDEAHRFAVFYYRHLHGKEFRNRTHPKKAGTKS